MSCVRPRRQGVFPVQGLYTRTPLGLSAKTQRLLPWLATNDRPLKRVMIVIDATGPGKSTTRRLSLGAIPDLLLKPQA